MATSPEGTPTFVFVLGTGRCGSTLVHEILARHPHVGFLSNLEDRSGHLLPGRWSGSLYRRLPTSLTTKGKLRFAPSEGYRILERAVSPAISTPTRDLVAGDATPWLAGRFSSFFDRLAAARRAPVVLHKFTGWPRAGFIDAALPSARFIHVIRDGRAVANSLLQMPWWDGYRGPGSWGLGPLAELDEKEWEASGRSFPVLAALQWRTLMASFEDARAAVPPERWLDVRFEDLLDDPRERVRTLLGFAGLTWGDAFERNFRHHLFDRSRKDAFRGDLRPTDVEDLNRVLGDQLEQLGYL